MRMDVSTLPAAVAAGRRRAPLEDFALGEQDFPHEGLGNHRRGVLGARRLLAKHPQRQLRLQLTMLALLLLLETSLPRLSRFLGLELGLKG